MKQTSIKSVHLFFVAFFGASSGLVLSVGNTVITAWMTSLGFDLVAIGVASLLGLPYLFKFLWAPFFDRYRFLRLPQARGWLVCTHLILALFVMALAYLPKLENNVLLPILMLFGFFAASLDIVVDGHRASIEQVTASQKNALYIFFYRMAMMFSGLTLVCADYFGWRIAFLSLAIYFVLGACLSLRVPSHDKVGHAEKQAFTAGWKTFFARQNAFLILSFVLIYKMSIGFAVSMNTPFLMRALNFTLTDIGVVMKGFGFAANIAGVFLGGYLINRMRLNRALFYFLALETLAIGLFVLMAHLPKNYTLMVFSVSFEQLSSGLATVAMLTFMMQQIDNDFKNSQFALLSSVMAFGRVLVAPFSGWAVECLGWGGFYLLAIGLSLPAFFLCVKKAVFMKS